MEGFSESDDSDVVASSSYKRRQLNFILAKVNGVSRHSLDDSGSDITVVEQSVAKQSGDAISRVSVFCSQVDETDHELY